MSLKEESIYISIGSISLFFFVLYCVFAITAQQAIPFFGLTGFEAIKLVSYFFGFSYVVVELVSINRNITYLIAAIIFIFALLSSLLIQHELFLGQFLSLLFSVFAAKLINEINPTNVKYLLIPFWVYAFFIIFSLIENPNPNEVFVNSRNWISYYLIIFVIPYYFVKFKHNDDFSIIPSLLTFLLSVYSFGRSGIAASLFILLGCLIIYKRKSLLFTLLMPFLMYLLYFLYDFLSQESIPFEYLVEIERFTNFFTDTGRGDMIDTYFSLMDVKGLLLGVNQNYFATLVNSSNFHNSFISLHSTTGLGFFFLVMIILFCLFKLFLINLSMSLLLIAVLIRISTDAGALFGYFDFSLWVFIFYCLTQNNLKLNQIH